MIKIGSFSDWTNIVKGILFILGPFLFNIFINNLLFFSAGCEICNFPHDNSLYSCGVTLDKIFFNLIKDMQNVYKWLVYNSMKVNLNKFQFIILGSTSS